MKASNHVFKKAMIRLGEIKAEYGYSDQEFPFIRERFIELIKAFASNIDALSRISGIFLIDRSEICYQIADIVCNRFKLAVINACDLMRYEDWDDYMKNIKSPNWDPINEFWGYLCPSILFEMHIKQGYEDDLYTVNEESERKEKQFIQAYDILNKEKRIIYARWNDWVKIIIRTAKSYSECKEYQEYRSNLDSYVYDDPDYDPSIETEMLHPTTVCTVSCPKCNHKINITKFQNPLAYRCRNCNWITIYGDHNWGYNSDPYNWFTKWQEDALKRKSKDQMHKHAMDIFRELKSDIYREEEKKIEMENKGLMEESNRYYEEVMGDQWDEHEPGYMKD